MAHPETRSVPEWDVVDRLKKSLRHAEMDSADIAQALGVRRETVSRWLNGKVPVNTRTLQAWAVATGVDVVWLTTGAANRPTGGGASFFGSLGFHPAPVAPAALAQSAERFTRNEECYGSAPVGLVDLAA